MKFDEVKLDPRVESYIIDNIDLAPGELVEQIKLNFGEICDGAKCLCKNMARVNELYLKYGKGATVPDNLHARLMNSLKDVCDC